MNLLEKAILFATEKHSGQVRKKSTLPYIVHPMEVAVIVSSMTDDINTMAAAVLHDTIEDTDVTPEELEALFGKTVRELVEGETENKRRESPPEETWLLRKQEALAVIRNSDNIEFKKLCLADKLSNMRSLKRLYDEEGPFLWNYFHQKDPKLQEQFYRSALESLNELSDTDAYAELSKTINYIFRQE